MNERETNDKRTKQATQPLSEYLLKINRLFSAPYRIVQPPSLPGYCSRLIAVFAVLSVDLAIVFLVLLVIFCGIKYVYLLFVFCALISNEMKTILHRRPWRLQEQPAMDAWNPSQTCLIPKFRIWFDAHRIIKWKKKWRNVVNWRTIRLVRTPFSRYFDQQKK